MVKITLNLLIRRAGTDPPFLFCVDVIDDWIGITPPPGGCGIGVAVNASLSSFKIPLNILLTSNLLNIVSYDAIINKEVKEMKKAITLTLDEQILAWAQEKAAEENRTLSNYIETLLIEEQKKD